jgi:hypothetical protein
MIALLSRFALTKWKVLSSAVPQRFVATFLVVTKQSYLFGQMAKTSFPVVCGLAVVARFSDVRIHTIQRPFRQYLCEARRLAAKARNATVNRELALLRRMFRMGYEQRPRLVPDVPQFPANCLKPKEPDSWTMMHSKTAGRNPTARLACAGFGCVSIGVPQG